MDWNSTFADAGVIAAASAAIFFIIDFIKKLYFKLPWGWVQKTPNEVWFALSILMGVGIALVVFWDNFFGSGATVSSGIASTVYGLVSGAGSKLINAVSSTAGVKLKASKESMNAKLEQPKEELVVAPEIITDDVEETVEEATVEAVVKVPIKADYVVVNGKMYKIGA